MSTSTTASNANLSSQTLVDATLKSRVSWERVSARNILGTIPGTDPTLGKETIIIDGYYDSMAITPDLAPGAEAAGNCAALLEMARYFKANPAPYTLMFLANGAHHMGLAGVRNFVAKHLVDSTGKATDAQKAKIKATRAFIGLDLTSRTETVGMFAKSSFYNQMTVGSENILLNQYFGFAKTMYEKYARPKLCGVVATLKSRSFSSTAFADWKGAHGVPTCRRWWHWTAKWQRWRPSRAFRSQPPTMRAICRTHRSMCRRR
jgi:Zn-dependent M28 family amino/carboxypeptidase